ncbi:MAG: hypothetical protein AC479_07205 [miscellaneous Crenarchaeota group-6 archaeon AD8-1]|nr:MAG: hypothetical protein AC479_07205 [miscellaneous Crenarchaeota group-6 archaeon AD8-1]
MLFAMLIVDKFKGFYAGIVASDFQKSHINNVAQVKVTNYALSQWKRKNWAPKTEAKNVAGISQIATQSFRGKIIEFLWWIQKQVYRESTITSRVARLKRLINLKANLLDPENVKKNNIKAKKLERIKKRRNGICI